MVKVYHCYSCNRTMFLAICPKGKCKICGSALVEMPIDFIDFVELSLHERMEYINTHSLDS